MEVVPYEDMMLRDAQPIAKIRFEHLVAVPEVSYDKLASSNYNREYLAPAL